MPSRLFAVTTIVHCTSQQHSLCILTLKLSSEEFSTGAALDARLFREIPHVRTASLIVNGFPQQ
ncbi:hypothetical protein TcasGA2_TC032237 [Tribolium castaneum]|uniref:Uncharacterized protein n=1 Tax=Tribolium castaneum TaxID=7070 RepID=A0A139WNC1_TRICA|nr:hypothetical protein TcasGA2_TC032237 [Tribolium castaneum]